MSDYPLSGLDYARAKPPGRPQVEPVFKGSPYAAGPRYSGGATNAPVLPAKPMASGALANATPKAPQTPAPTPTRPASALAQAAPPPSAKDSDFARNVAGASVYANQMTNPQEQKEYGRAIYSDSFQGATKSGFAEGLKPPKPLSAQELKDRQLYWQQVRAGVDADISRRALTKAAFNRGEPESVRQSAMAQLGGMAEYPQRAAQFAQETDLKQQALAAANQAADREWQGKQSWFNDPVPEPIPDNATEEMIANTQARNDAIQARALQAKKNIWRWVLEQRAQGVDTDPFDYYFQNPDIAAEYAPQSFGQSRGYADGGVVENTYSGSGGGIDLLAKYQDYVARTQEVGAEPVPFEAFSQMQDGAMQRFATGGPVAGKMVLDTDPNAPVDSIPATVDDESPARLNSGEFVFPSDVVAYFGTDRLNKMIQAARKGAMAGAQ